jgi:hypothetical protein
MILNKRVHPMTSTKALGSLILLMALPMAACSTVTSAVQGPEMAPMGYPAQLVPQYQQVMMQPTSRETGPASANSLWRNGARAFFIDQRASRIGEINQFDSPAFGNGSPHAIQHVIYLLRHTVILVAWRGAAGCC